MTVSELIKNLDDEHIIILRSSNSSGIFQQEAKYFKDSKLYSKLEIKKIKNITEVIV